jgi:hypothetical protein
LGVGALLGAQKGRSGCCARRLKVWWPVVVVRSTHWWARPMFCLDKVDSGLSVALQHH